MRVKTVPRQRISQGNANVGSVRETVTRKIENSEQRSNDEEKKVSKGESDALLEPNDSGEGDQSKDLSVKVKEKMETSIHLEKVLNMSIKIEEDSVLLSLIAGPSCNYSNSHSKRDTKEFISNDDNNNIITSETESENYSCVAGCSSKEDSESCENKDEEREEALNLCKRDCEEKDVSNHNVGSDEKLKDTFLYKIMTDPTFLDNIQKSKQTKRYMCEFCKQTFGNSDELADHMDVKKDESNQVICCACKKTFAQKRYLRYHQRCHSERTMFTCDICTKKYTRMDNLSRHNAFHVNPDKFSCTFCEKTFARKDLLNKHLKSHDKNRFMCEVCQRYFKGPLTLDNHKKNFHSIV
ncbi:oocyte zinc finger protein XlCOF6-like [Apis laboriosa]|uniref:oocyte zinc finger protein XlCOF6-like n=1 Tax=Apis laboriosa TaxID=183418 RepID=UPI001CC612BE|nr:oocyte zinc finger protein XlCOF6-like [Apis laboriosa]